MAESTIYKYIGETITVSFNFKDRMLFGATLSSASTTSTVASGVDDVASSMILGSAAISGSIVTQKIRLGMGGVCYALTCNAIDSNGNSYAIQRNLAVLTNTGSYGAPQGLAIIGTISALFCLEEYFNETLTIVNGYQPYQSITISSGAMPTGWSIAVVGNSILIDGLAVDTLPTTHTFTIELIDFIGNVAYSTQTIGLYDCDAPDPIAAEIAPYFLDWYPFDSNVDSAPYPALTFINNWVGYSPYNSFVSGKVGQAAYMNNLARVSGYQAFYDYVVGEDFFFTVWANVRIDDRDQIFNIGLGRNTTPGNERNPFITIRFVITGVSPGVDGVCNVSSHTFDYGPPQQYSDSTPVVVAAGWHLFAYSYHGATKTVTLWKGTTPIGTAVLLTHPPLEAYSWIQVVADHPIGAGQYLVIPFDELNFFGGIEYTTAIATYLYNGNAGKSYAQFVIDSGL